MPNATQPTTVGAGGPDAGGFLSNLADGASPLAIVAGEFEILLKRIYEPHLLVSTSFIEHNTVTVWGAFTTDPDHFIVEVYRGIEDEYNWAFCPRQPGHNQSPTLIDVRITGDGLSIYDQNMRKTFVYPLEDPDCFEDALNQVVYEIECKLGEAESRFEWVAFEQTHNPEFDEYGDVESRLYVLKRNRRLFDQRFRAQQL